MRNLDYRYRERLQPFAEKFFELDRLWNQLSPKARRQAVRAARAANTGNCWWAIYEAAKFVKVYEESGFVSPWHPQ